MKFIEALRFKSKLLLLFLSITVGLLFVSVVGISYIERLKKNIDELYFGSLLPVNELNTIIHIYDYDLTQTVFKSKYDLISKDEAIQEIKTALKQIETNWNSYTEHYKTREELSYVEFATQEIEKTDKIFYTILKYLKSHQNLSAVSLKSVTSHIEHITKVVSRLLRYEMENAKLSRKEFLKFYKSILLSVVITLGFILFAVLVVTFMVFKGIATEHTKLQNMTQKLKKLNKKLENASYTDSLTGLYNRRFFNLVFERELKRARRNKSYITFMMIDIDYFKQYNDTYGHIAGDNALKEVAKTIKEKFKRPSDYVFRLGGEEFGVLFLDTDEINSARLAKELNTAVKDKNIEHKNSKAGDVVTVSIGVVSCIADEMLDPDMLISKADDMLYEAKRSGRDKYMITTQLYLTQEIYKKSA